MNISWIICSNKKIDVLFVSFIWLVKSFIFVFVNYFLNLIGKILGMFVYVWLMREINEKKTKVEVGEKTKHKAMFVFGVRFGHNKWKQLLVRTKSTYIYMLKSLFCCCKYSIIRTFFALFRSKLLRKVHSYIRLYMYDSAAVIVILRSDFDAISWPNIKNKHRSRPNV